MIPTADGQDGGSNYYRGIGWHRKTVYLQFQGSTLVTNVYVDGTAIGEPAGRLGRSILM
ncbi:MAG TPA: hypothetical protein VH518_15770 [Tepidisphaeraceae bacterium]|jgi:beta-galactosidase